MEKYLLLFGSYSDIDYEVFVDCLGIFGTEDEARETMARERESDDESDEVTYEIKKVKITE